jgi:hypothetical protein
MIQDHRLPRSKLRQAYFYFGLAADRYQLVEFAAGSGSVM